MEPPIIDIIKFATDKELKLNYLCKTSRVIYSISNMAGTIILYGNFHWLVDNIIPIDNLLSGAYLLCIIDGDKFYKTSFHKN